MSSAAIAPYIAVASMILMLIGRDDMAVGSAVTLAIGWFWDKIRRKR